MSERKGMAWIWPETSDDDSAKEAAKQGVWACSFIAIVTGGMAFFQAMGFDSAAFVDAFLFAIIGFGIFKLSRTAAVAGLVLYLIERIYMWATFGSKNIAMAILLSLMFVNSIRGTFSSHKIKRESNTRPSIAQ